jgi:lysine-N-methylase
MPMKLITPSYYGKFRCLAGKCPDTCCAGWEVVVDDAAAAQYDALPAEFAALRERIAGATERDGGDRIFRCGPNGRCPFLNRENLCDIQSALGETGLCRTCALYPRFISDFGGRREIGLSLSCPEAARIILSHDGKVAFAEENAPSIPPSLNDLDADRYFAVQQLRERLLQLAQTRQLTIDERCALMLRLARKGQKKLRKKDWDEVPALAEQFETHNLMAQLPLCWRRSAEAEPVPMEAVWEALQDLSILRPEWAEMLDGCDNDWIPAQMEKNIEQQLLTTFLYRYVMRAAYGENLHSLVKFCVFSVLAIRQLALRLPRREFSDVVTLVTCYSREVEHDPDNVDALLRMLKADKRFGNKSLKKRLEENASHRG